MENLLKKLRQAKMDMEAAKVRGSGVAAARDRIKNLMYTNYAVITEALDDHGKMTEEIEMLNNALSEADRELAALRKKGKKAANADAGTEIE